MKKFLATVLITLCILVPCSAQMLTLGVGSASKASAIISPVAIDAIAPVATAANVQIISLNMTVSNAANALLMIAHFNYSQHAGFGVTWTVGATVQTMTVTPNFNFILTSDNGASAPAIALIGLINPTPGTGTLTMAFTSAADNLVMEAVSFKNTNILGGLSTAFAAAKFVPGGGTSNAAAPPSMPAIPGGIAMGFAGGIVSSPTTWSVGTQLYNASSGADTWGSGVYQSIGTAGNFSLGINASVSWAAAGVVVNPSSVLPSGTIAVNHGNSISSGLVVAVPVLGKVTLTDLISGKTAIPTAGTSTDVSGGYGGGLKFPASTTDVADFGNFQPIPNSDYTVLVVANPPSGVQGVLLGQADSSVAGFVILETNSNDAANGAPGFMSSTVFNGSVFGSDDGARAISSGTYHVGMIDGNYHAFAGRVASGVASVATDGAITTANSTAVGGTFTNTNQHFAIGNLGNFTGGTFSANATIVLVLVWNRALSDAELKSITAQPFQVLNFLLKRDLDPASNDNDPMWSEKAA